MIIFFEGISEIETVNLANGEKELDFWPKKQEELVVANCSQFRSELQAITPISRMSRANSRHLEKKILPFLDPQ